MKHRWIVLLGKIGSILLTAGLALGTVYMIPAIPGPTSEPKFTLWPERWLFFSHPVYQTCHLQKGIRILVTSNNSLQFYLVATQYLEVRTWLFSWIKEHFPALNESQYYTVMYNISILEAYLQTCPENVMLSERVNGEWSTEFFPQKVANVTIIVSNPSLAAISVNLKTTPIATLVPRQRALTITEILIISGIVLAIPRIALHLRYFELRKEKPK